MTALRRRISKLEQAQPTGNIWEPRMARVVCRRYAREVAAGTRKPEDATEEAALAELRSIPAMAGASLAEKMEGAIRRGKVRREHMEPAQ